MSRRPISQSTTLKLAATAIGTIFLGFGINGMLRPEQALTFFEFQSPALASDKTVVNGLVIVESARDVFMGLAIYAAAYFGSGMALGCIVVAASAVAFVDGAVCWVLVGKGEWNHWGYAPVLTLVGASLMGIWDRF